MLEYPVNHPTWQMFYTYFGNIQVLTQEDFDQAFMLGNCKKKFLKICNSTSVTSKMCQLGQVT